MAGASERLKLFEADLNNGPSFRESIEGAEYVLHVASPYALTVQDAQVCWVSCRSMLRVQRAITYASHGRDGGCSVTW